MVVASQQKPHQPILQPNALSESLSDSFKMSLVAFLSNAIKTIGYGWRWIAMILHNDLLPWPLNSADLNPIEHIWNE